MKKILCPLLFKRFRNGDYDKLVNDKLSGLNEMENNVFEALLNENLAQTLKEFAGQLRVDELTVSCHLKAIK